MTESPTVLAVVTTTDTVEKAQALAAGAVAARVAACAQIDGPITSVYRWEGEVRTDQEWRIVCKTTTDRYPALEVFLTENHDYDTPEIIATPVTHGSEAYVSWVGEETAGG